MNKTFFYSSLLLVIFFISCKVQRKKQLLTKANKGKAWYGGVFKMNETSSFRSLYPLDVTEVVGHRIGSQVYEGLVKLNQKDLSILPALASSWRIDSAKIYTFVIRKGVYFHEDTCFFPLKTRMLTVKDVKYSLDRLCLAAPNNQMYWLFKNKLKGADKTYKNSLKGNKPISVEGIKILNDSTLQIELLKPFSGFLKILSHSACWIYPKEAVDFYAEDIASKAIGTGPFKAQVIAADEVVILRRNENYWRKDSLGNSLPYLKAVKVFFIKDKKAELMSFMQKKLDMVYRLPIEMIKDIKGRFLDSTQASKQSFVIQDAPAMSIFYYGFQNKQPPFDDVLVRKAFNYAIDRKTLVKYTLFNEGTAANYGFVPPMSNYDYKAIKGYEYNPKKAAKLLKQAGYSYDAEFPLITLQTNPGGGDRNVQVAEVIQRMLKENLGIDVNIEMMQFAQHLENLETGKAVFWRSAWIADYPDPENFLNLLYGGHVPKNLSDKSYINSVRYQNSNFDSLFQLASKETDELKRNYIYQQADQQAIDDAAVMPLFYDNNIRLVQKNVMNFPLNGMEYRDLSTVYFIPKNVVR